MFFRIGSIVEVIIAFTQSKHDPGCIAKVVDGKFKFPKLYKELQTKVSDVDFDEFIWVVWNKKDPRWKGSQDGAYMGAAFQLADENKYWFDDDEITQKIVIEEPKNNDGRSQCFWCREDTIKKLGLFSTYDICPKCKK